MHALKMPITGFVADTRKTRALYDKLQSWDMSKVMEHATKKGILPARSVRRAREEYTRFVALCVAHPFVLTPIGDRVDDFWHTHLIFTEDYAAMCQQLFGRFLHHRPGVLEDTAPDTRLRDKRRVIYREVFGEPDRLMWAISRENRDHGSNGSRDSHV